MRVRVCVDGWVGAWGGWLYVDSGDSSVVRAPDS